MTRRLFPRLPDPPLQRRLLLCLSFALLSLNAQDTWDGGSVTTDEWTDAANWGGVAPVAGNLLQFGGGVRLTPDNNFAAGTAFSGLSFLADAGLFVLGGNSINLSGGISSAAVGIQTVDMDIVLQSPLAVQISANDATSRLTLSGDISGSHGLTLSGTETFGYNRVTLSGANSYTGTTTVGTPGNRVTAWITDPGSLPGNVVVEEGSTLRLRPEGIDKTIANDISISGEGVDSLGRATWAARNNAGALILNNDVDVTGTVTLTGDSRISANRDDLGTSGTSGTISGQITGDFDLQFGFVQERPGTVTITNPGNDWGGDTYVTGGGATGSSGRQFRLRLGADHVLPYGAAAGDLYIGTHNTILDTVGNDVNINGLNNGAGTFGTITGGGSFTLGHNDANGNYDGSLTVTSLTKVGTGTQSLGGVTNSSAGVEVDAGILRIDGGRLVGGPVSVADGATLDLAGGELRYTSGTAMNLNTTGTFTFTSGKLAGTNWTGGLDGLSIGAGQIVGPGTSPGAATTGSQTWTGGGTFQFEINDATGAEGTNWDHLTVTGDLDISGLTSGDPFLIDLVSLNGIVSGQALNFDETGTYDWEFASFGNLIGTFSSDLFQVNTGNFQNVFTESFEVKQIGDTFVVSYIPEPSSLLLLVVGGLGMLGLRKRCR